MVGVQDAWFHIAFQDEWWVNARGWFTWKSTFSIDNVPSDGKRRIDELSGALAWKALAHLHGKLWVLPLVADDFDDESWPAHVQRPRWNETPSFETTAAEIAKLPCLVALHTRAEQMLPWPRQWWDDWLGEAVAAASASDAEEVRRRVMMFNTLSQVECWGEVLHDLPRLAKLRLELLGPSVLDALLADGVLPQDAIAVADALRP